MSNKKVPNPKLFPSVSEWAAELYRHLSAPTRFKQTNDPLPVLLPHVSGDERAAVDGILLYDPTQERVVVSINGVFVPLLIAADLP